ncbi:hypothetical protein [Ammoniphilus resinae]|uniref:Phage protein n=1 Tax=Ammoniphilus resinae TaxID=861532 RepID=A0ABS4GJN8_9BACL|nr:hypothetical protein [Ammoniphilus resinae]MBP1930488.1 hypothetical protein [Ammoniphilus resinae]
MIQLVLKKDAMNTMYFDDINEGRASFTNEAQGLTASLSEEEFDGFMKSNNLIVYHNTIKGYETGEIYGEFTAE